MRLWFIGVLFVMTANAQQPCPSPNYQVEVSAGLPNYPDAKIVMLRQGDGTYTGIEMTTDIPARVIRRVPNYGKQFAGCVTKNVISTQGPTAVGGPAAVGPQAISKAGNYFFSQVSTALTPSLAVQVFDPNLNLLLSASTK